MSFAVKKTRVLSLILVTITLGPLAGCTEFQSMCSNKWLDHNWLQSDAGVRADDMFIYWDNNVRLVEDTESQGIQRPGLAGRFFLFSDGQCVEAQGRIVVKMEDLTRPEPGKPLQKIGEWSIPAHALKQLKRKDALGMGYTLFLPWPDFNPSVKEVKLQVCYIPEKGSPRYSTPSRLVLQADDQFISVLREWQSGPGLGTLESGPRRPVAPTSLQKLPGRN